VTKRSDSRSRCRFPSNPILQRAALAKRHNLSRAPAPGPPQSGLALEMSVRDESEDFFLIRRQTPKRLRATVRYWWRGAKIATPWGSSGRSGLATASASAALEPRDTARAAVGVSSQVVDAAGSALALGPASCRDPLSAESTSRGR
jgi:hypothetical protein